jgi:hypothetical protein
LTRPRICVRRRPEKGQFSADYRTSHDFAQAAPASVRRRAFARACRCAALGREGALPEGIDLSRVVVEPPKDAAHGDMATNAAMVLAKEAKAKPRDLADRIADKLRADPLIEKVDIAGPGFINLTLQPSAWFSALRSVLEQGNGYGRSAIGAAEKVNVEYVSANPTGPMHVGHCRGAVFGDALASLLSFAGYDVTKEYYINDAGAQVDVLARSAFLRYREALGETIGEIRKDFIRVITSSPSARSWPPSTAISSPGSPKPNGFPCARQGHRHDDGDDQGRSRRAEHQARCVLLGAFAQRERQRSRWRDHRRTAREGRCL